MRSLLLVVSIGCSSSPHGSPLELSPSAPVIAGSGHVVLPDAIMGEAYAATIVASGGTPPYTYLASGALHQGIDSTAGPDGVTIAGSAQQTIEIDSRYTLDVTVTDAASQTLTQSFELRLDAAAAVIATDIPHPRAGVAYTATLAATGGTGALTWSIVQGSLPASMTLSAAGVLAGTPSATEAVSNVGAYAVMLQATDSLTDAATGAPAPRTVMQQVTVQIDPGYRVNVFPLIKTTYTCTACHTGGSIVPDFTGAQTAGSEDASKLVNVLAGGTPPNGVASQCNNTHTYVVPGTTSSSLVYQKIGGDAGTSPPCGACMPYGMACTTFELADRLLLARWIASLPAAPTANDLK